MNDAEILEWLLQRRPDLASLTPEEADEWLRHVAACGGVENTALAPLTADEEALRVF